MFSQGGELLWVEKKIGRRMYNMEKRAKQKEQRKEFKSDFEEIGYLLSRYAEQRKKAEG